MSSTWSRAGLRAALALLIGALVVAAAPQKVDRAKLSADSLESLQKIHSQLLSDVRLAKSRLALAHGDSIYLVLDGTKKTLTLEIGGVSLRECPLLALRIDRRLERERRSAAFQESLAYPFPLLRREGTVTENPPPMDVDTSAAVRRWQEEERKRDVRFSLHFERDLVLHVTTRPDESGGPTGFWPRLEARWHRLKTSLGQWLGFRSGGKEPEDVFLLMDRSDALAVYRALPEKTGLALRL